MDKRPTIRDVAIAANVSIGTVSRVAAESKAVSPDTRRRVEDAMRSLGYVPNIAARTMRTNRTKIVGLLIPDLANTVFIQVAKAAERLLEMSGYTLFLYSSERSVKREIAFLRIAARYRMDGLIISLSNEGDKDVLEALRAMESPIVLLDRDVPLRADVVYSEHAQAMRHVVTHLLELGHRRIALITAPLSIRPGRERVRGYREAILGAGLEIDETLIAHDLQTTRYGLSKALEMLQRPDRPTALVAGGDEIFYGALRAVRQLGLSIPRDLSLVGADSRMLADLMSPTITMIDRDMSHVGETAAELLVRRMTIENVSLSEVHLPSEVILRESTARLRPEQVMPHAI